jgi:serine/threonine protein kinase
MLSPSLVVKLGDFGICKMHDNKGGRGRSGGSIDVVKEFAFPTTSPLSFNKGQTPTNSRKGPFSSFNIGMTTPRKFVDENLWGSEAALELTSNVGTARYMAPEVSTHNKEGFAAISQ